MLLVHTLSIIMFLFASSSKDLLMRVVAQNLSPELTLVEKVILLQLFNSAFNSVAKVVIKFLTQQCLIISRRSNFLNGSLIGWLQSPH